MPRPTLCPAPSPLSPRPAPLRPRSTPPPPRVLSRLLLLRAPLLLLLLLLRVSGPAARACYIAGYDSGECRTYDENELYMPFCAKVVKYTACVPLTRQTAGGDWDNHTLPNKDAWVEEQAMAVVLERIRHEMNETLDELDVNELGEEGEVKRRFWNGNTEDPRAEKFKARRGGSPLTDCETAYIGFMCYLNFPRCNEEGQSLVLCRSVCENYMIACGYDKELWRCGDVSYLGAEKPEVPTQDDESGVYNVTVRAPFTGAPFRDNEFDRTDPDNPIPIAICTPSMIAAGRRHGASAAAGAAWATVVGAGAAAALALRAV